MIEGLGRMHSPLGTIRLDGATRLIVSPWAAMGTDLLLISTGIATVSLSRSTPVTILGWGGTAWGVVALLLETLKLAQGGEVPDVEIVRQ